MIEILIICFGLFIMFGVSLIPVAVSVKSDKKETLEDVIRQGLTAIALNIFMGTFLVLVKMGFLIKGLLK